MQLAGYQRFIDGLSRQFAFSGEGASLRVFYVVLFVVNLHNPSVEESADIVIDCAICQHKGDIQPAVP